ncbi:MAG: YlxR family protein [Oscillospiraceae bacterium]|nr:YlxR family protein [Oscillospiraceae bacterium]
MKERREAIRQCMGCRNHLPKRELLRVVRSPEGTVALDTNGKAQGRGVYLCRDAVCFKKVRKSRALERSLKSPVSDEIFNTIEELLTGNGT